MTTTIELTVAGTKGVWAVRSESATVYYLDTYGERLLRAPGEGSTVGPYDGCWVALVSVESESGAGVIKVGDRHRWLTDPEPGARDYRWWVQRRCIAIEPVPAEDVPAGREPEPGEKWRVSGRRFDDHR